MHGQNELWPGGVERDNLGERGRAGQKINNKLPSEI